MEIGLWKEQDKANTQEGRNSVATRCEIARMRRESVGAVSSEVSCFTLVDSSILSGGTGRTGRNEPIRKNKSIGENRSIRKNGENKPVGENRKNIPVGYS